MEFLSLIQRKRSVFEFSDMSIEKCMENGAKLEKLALCWKKSGASQKNWCQVREKWHRSKNWRQSKKWHRLADFEPVHVVHKIERYK